MNDRESPPSRTATSLLQEAGIHLYDEDSYTRAVEGFRWMLANFDKMENRKTWRPQLVILLLSGIMGTVSALVASYFSFRWGLK